MKPSAEELAEIKKGLGHLPKQVKIAARLDAIKIAKIKDGGCAACNQSGYSGRKGVYEVFLVDAEMEKFILTNPPSSSIKTLLVKKGMVTMYQAGLIEVVEGETTLEEVKKVVAEEN